MFMKLAVALVVVSLVAAQVSKGPKGKGPKGKGPKGKGPGPRECREECEAIFECGRPAEDELDFYVEECGLDLPGPPEEPEAFHMRLRRQLGEEEEESSSEGSSNEEGPEETLECRIAAVQENEGACLECILAFAEEVADEIPEEHLEEFQEHLDAFSAAYECLAGDEEK